MFASFADVQAAIRPVDTALFAVAKAHLDNLTKPRGSLGRLEELAMRLFAIGGGRAPAVDPARIYVCAGDHGVAAEGVSLYPQDVTRQMVLNFLNGGAGINVLAKTAGVDLKVVDAGCLGDPFPPHPAFAGARVASGTADMAKEPAMRREVCEKALLLGVSLAGEAAAEGIKALGTGDMGIANTTPSTALYCAFLGLTPEDVTGPGTGLSAEGVRRKAAVVRRALDLHRDVIAAGGRPRHPGRPGRLGNRLPGRAHPRRRRLSPARRRGRLHLHRRLCRRPGARSGRGRLCRAVPRLGRARLRGHHAGPGRRPRPRPGPAPRRRHRRCPGPRPHAGRGQYL